MTLDIRKSIYCARELYALQPSIAHQVVVAGLTNTPTLADVISYSLESIAKFESTRGRVDFAKVAVMPLEAFDIPTGFNGTDAQGMKERYQIVLRCDQALLDRLDEFTRRIAHEYEGTRVYRNFALRCALRCAYLIYHAPARVPLA